MGSGGSRSGGGGPEGPITGRHRRRGHTLTRHALKKTGDWPRYMKVKTTTAGKTLFFWRPHERDIAAGICIRGEALGGNFETAANRARLLNEQLDSWRSGRQEPAVADARVGTVDWWHHLFFQRAAFGKLKERTQRDYRRALQAIADLPTQMIDPRTGHPATGSLTSSWRPDDPAETTARTSRSRWQIHPTPLQRGARPARRAKDPHASGFTGAHNA